MKIVSNSFWWYFPVMTSCRSWSRPRRAGWLLVAVFCLADGCAPRKSGDIDVDSVQGQVDAIDSHLSRMREALEKKDIGQAREELESAQEMLAENSDDLAAYPEAGELKDRVRRASVTLCAGEVEYRLSEYFAAIRARDTEGARKKLGAVTESWKGCSASVGQAGEMLALKASVEAAPTEITRLEQSLADERATAEVAEVERALSGRMDALEAGLAGAEKTPPSAEQLAMLQSTGRELQASFEQEAARLKANSRWPDASGRLGGRMGTLTGRFAALSRRSRISSLAKDDVVRAEQLSQAAIIQRDVTQARQTVAEANRIYQACLEQVTALLAEEPALGKFRFTWKGMKRTVGWLKSHCQANAKITGRMLEKLGQKPAVKPSAPSPGSETKPPAAPKPRRKSRIKRW